MRRIKLSIAKVIIYILLMLNPVVAKDQLRFGSFQIPIMVEDKDNGVFVELAKEICKRSKLDMEIVISSPKRTVMNFTNHQLDVLFPALDVNFPDGFEVAKSVPIYIKKDYVFTKKNKPMLKTIKELEGKKVALTLGYPYVNELIDNKLVLSEMANSDVSNAKKLVANRVDAFVVELASGLKAFELADLKDNYQFDIKIPLSKQDVYFAVNNTARGKEVVKLISDALNKMKSDGTYDKIMSKIK